MTRDLRPLFDPSSVAVVGASDDPVKWGYGLARGALRGADRRPVYLVNRSGGEILGRRAYRSLAELPGPAELVVVAVPERAFEETVDAALAAGAKALIGITAGLGESGDEGLARERAVAERVRAAGAILLGPNCLGAFDAASRLDIGWSELPAGPIGLVSQSGNLALELALLADEVGLGFSRFASLGNQADLEAAELVTSFAADPATRVVALYVEDFRDGREFASACHAATLAGKPVILLAAGGSDASVRAARSHTGALVSDLVAVRAASGAAGIELVRTPQELVDLSLALLTPDLPKGRRLAVFGDGGGHGVIASDLASEAGFDLPRLSDGLAAGLADALGPTASTRNPVDLAGGGEQDFSSFERVARLLLESGEVDAAVLTGYFGGYAEYGPEYEASESEVALAMAHAAAEAGRPLAVQTMYPRGPAARILRSKGIPVYGDIEAAIATLARLADRALNPPTGVSELPPQRGEDIHLDGYFDARTLLSEAGVPFVEARRVTTTSEAREAAEELGYPVVLKALGLLHKSDAGGVALGIEGPEALERIFSEMATRLRAPGYSVERTAPLASGIELIAGTRLDARFGPIVLVGIGGIYAELLRDVAVALAPVTATEAERLLHSLRGSPLLLGARGRPPLAVPHAAAAISALSQAAAERPAIGEIEVNPLLVTPDRALALDARIVPAQKGDQGAR